MLRKTPRPFPPYYATAEMEERVRATRDYSTPSYGYVGGGSSTRGGFLSESESNYVGGHQLTVSSSGYCGSDHMQTSSEVRSYWSQQGKPKSVVSSRVSSGYSSSVGTANETSSAGESPLLQH